jgi:amino acid adenylation domain-containing protein
MSTRLSAQQLAALRERVERARDVASADAIPRRTDSGPAELSFAQQRLWFLDQLVPGNPFYNIPSALPLRLRIDEPALRRALSAIVQRHEALRTRFISTASGPRQVVGEPYDPMGATVDLAPLPAVERQAKLERIATEEARAPFDLTRGPLVRACLVRLSDAEHVLLLTMHHIVSDGWSMGVLFRELMQLYDAFVRSKPSPLAALPIQYADYAVWQRRMLSPQRMEALLSYWRAQLAGLPTLALVTDRPRPPMATFRGAFLEVAFEAELTARLGALAHRLGATLFQVLLAAFKAVLSRYTGQIDIVVGAPIANRMRPELEGLIGFFVNSLVLRTDLGGDPTFADIVARVRRTAIAAYEHQDLPFEKLVEELQPARDMSRNPLAQVTFQIQNAPSALREKPEGLDLVVRVDRATAIFDLAFSLWETRSGLVGGIEYASDIFDWHSMRQLVDALTCVLRAVLADDAVRLSALPLATPAEQQRQRALLLGAEVALPEPGLFEAFRAQAQVAGDRPVLVDSHGVLTQGALLQQSLQLCTVLAARGVESGDIVALAVPRGRRFVVLMLATLGRGAAWLPLDPSLPPARMRRMLEVAAPRLVLREGEPLLETLFAESAQSAAAVAQPVPADAPAYVLFTSGSTGTPKGVVVSQRALSNHMAWMRAELPIGESGRVLQRTPLHFDAAIWELWAPLLGDGMLVLPEPFEAADTGRLCETIERYAPTVLQIVPSLLRVLLDDPAIGRCCSLSRLCIGGEALAADLIAKARVRWPSIEIVNLYGPTEATIDATWWRADPAWAPDAPVPIGRPVWNTQVSIRDNLGRPLPPGIVGEICIAGAALALGYLGASEEDRARFVTETDGRRVYRTGDRGWARHDGLLFCAGRLDQQVKVRGNRIELGDIEAALTAHPSVQAAVAVALPDEGGAPELAAFVTVDNAAALAAGTDLHQMEGAHLEGWRTLYQTVYDLDAQHTGDAAFDTVGWTSSYDGTAIAAPAMGDWLDATLARLQALTPRRVLELGAGAGLILSGLASRCQRYVACDFSAPAIERARRAIEARRLTNVRLVHCAAHEADRLGEGGFDTAILNSVIQYFPSLEHLVDVLKHTQHLLAPGGRVFVGDVRHYGLMEAFHADVQTHRAVAEALCGELRERVRAATAQDKELLVAPAFYWRIAEWLPEFGRVTVRLKRGRVRSEMLDFRYDVVLEAGPSPAAPPLVWEDWRRAGLSLATLAARLQTQNGELALAAIPNARVQRAAALAATLSEAADALAVSELRAAADASTEGGVDPDALARVADAAGWTAELLPSPRRAEEFEVVLHRGTLTPFQADAAVLARSPAPRGRIASNPLLATIGPALERSLKVHLAQHLPAAWVPSRIEPRAQLPLLPNGKADRNALAALAARRRTVPSAMLAPEDALEALLADIWAAVLRLQRVSVTDHFFSDLGGHSLLATQAVSRVREALDIDLPLRLLFEHPTVRALSKALVATHPDGARLVRLAELVRQVDALDEAALDQLLATKEAAHG